MKLTGIIFTVIVVVLGFVWLSLTAIPGAALSSLSVGFGLTETLQKTPLVGGYNMNQLVLFIVFIIIIAVLGAIFMKKEKKS